MHFFKSLLGLILLNGFTAVVVMRDAAASQTESCPTHWVILKYKTSKILSCLFYFSCPLFLDISVLFTQNYALFSSKFKIIFC